VKAGLLLAAVLLIGCSQKPAPKPPVEYQMRGEVIRLDPSARLATIKGEEIQGWMPAMTMEYPIKDKQEFQKLKAGEQIQAKVLVQGADYWLADVSEAPAAPAPPPK
jgi:Cu/Ag efflux protein CusF